jgi:hypothetical protein
MEDPYIDRDTQDAFSLVPVGFGTLAPGAVGAVLEQAYEVAVEGRDEMLVTHGFSPEPPGDVIVICCARDHAEQFAGEIVRAMGVPGTIRDENTPR